MSGPETIERSTNSVVYDAIRTFRNETFSVVRAYAKKASGAKYLAELKELIGKDRWDHSLRSAKQLRVARAITSPLIDDFDAQDISDLPRIFDKKYDALVDVKGQRAELLEALKAIASFRNGIGHPAVANVTIDDARRLAGNMSTAAGLIFGKQTTAYKNVSESTQRLFDYEPPAAAPTVKVLPPRHEILRQFIGRERELRTLYSWLESTLQLWILEGDGGKGKSSLAFVFCESLEYAGGSIDRVIWLSAKSRKFDEGSTRSLNPDFNDLESAFKAVISAYDFGDAAIGKFEELEKLVVELLQSWPALIVLDDIDSLERENDNVTYWFTNTLKRLSPKCKILLTTRRELFGFSAYTTKVDGLSYDETKGFLRSASAKAYGDPDKLGSGQTPKLIHEATDGSPLYLEDLVRLVLILGKPPHEVVKDWKSVRGRDVREYALRREFEMLSAFSKEVLLAAAIAGDPISRAELLAVVGAPDQEVEAAISELRRFFLISPPDVAALTPTFEVNRNLGILVKTIMETDPSFKKVANALSQIRDRSGKPHRVAKDAQAAIRDAVALVTRDRHEEAESLLKRFLEKYPLEGSLLSHLGWVLSHWPGGKRQIEAMTVLQRAVDLKHRHEATYVNLGELYLVDRQYDRAASALSVGLELFPEDSRILQMHAQAKANAALELYERTESISESGKKVVREPLQEALRAIMDVIKDIRLARAPVPGLYQDAASSELTQEVDPGVRQAARRANLTFERLIELDRKLREAINNLGPARQ